MRYLGSNSGAGEKYTHVSYVGISGACIEGKGVLLTVQNEGVKIRSDFVFTCGTCVYILRLPSLVRRYLLIETVARKILEEYNLILG